VLAKPALHLRQNSMRMVVGVLHHRRLPVGYLAGILQTTGPGKCVTRTSQRSMTWWPAVKKSITLFSRWVEYTAFNDRSVKNL
jgi:hypothetical protein